MFRVAKRNFSRFGVSISQNNLITHLNAAKFSGTVLKDGEYIDGEQHSSHSHKHEKKREIKKNFVELNRLKNAFEHSRPTPTNRAAKTSINDSYKNVMEKFKFEVAEEEPDQTVKNTSRQTTSSFDQSSKVKQQTAQKLSEIKKKNEADLNGLLSKLKKVEDSDIKKNIQKLPNRLKLKEIQENVKKSRETVREYFEGEEGVDTLHLDANRASFIPDMVEKITREVIAAAEMRKGRKYPEGLINSWRESVAKDQGINFTDTSDVKEYPGSSQGPLPEDDPDFFADWYVNNIPKEMKEILMKTQESNRGTSEETAELSTEHIIQSDVANTEIPFTFPEDNMAQSNMTVSYYSNYQDWEIAPLPDTLTNDPQQDPHLIEKWAMFRIYPRMIEFMSTYNDMLKQSLQYESDKKVIIPTLWRYYQLLPTFARDHPLVKNVFIGLEFTKHRQNLKEKELLLNMVCQYILPYEEWHVKSLSEALISQKYFVPLWEELQFLDEGEGGDDDQNEDNKGDNEDKKKKKEKRKIAAPVFDPERYKEAVKNEDLILHEDWPVPERHLDPLKPRDPQPSLPIDYFDNDDGFWTDYIKNKEAKYNDLPLVAPRRYFKH